MQLPFTNNNPPNERPAQPPSSSPKWAYLTNEVELFRRRALECRQAAERTPHGPWRLHLESIAEELDKEAGWIASAIKR
ncbi:hypothetical protein GCM10022276_11910 [Sphingomonas limnosediminicola]|uniref:Uncharacterized protein n=1 Tax=Sphingomonas limnosediminicola TaxID=940133 RepID=A0ABP7L3M2_9SPHN